MTTAVLTTISLDCADPGALGEFYHHLTGWPVTTSGDDAVYLGEGPVQLALQRVEGYQGPGWPSGSKHAHLDFTVEDLDAAVDRLVGLGAQLPEFQPGDREWIVLLDPADHPFCIAAS